MSQIPPLRPPLAPLALNAPPTTAIVAPPPPAQPASAPPMALPVLQAASALDGAFTVSGTALAGPPLTAWDYFVDALIKFFTLWQVPTRAYDHKVDPGYWRSAALCLLAGRGSHPLDEVALQAVLIKLTLALEAAHGKDFHAKQIAALVGDTVRRVQSGLSSEQVQAFVTTVGDPEFHGRAAVLDILCKDNMGGRDYWPALVPLLHSQAFVAAPPRLRAQMLNELACDVDASALSHIGRELSAFALAQQQRPCSFRIGASTDIGSHVYAQAGAEVSATAVIDFGDHKITVNYPKAEGHGYRPSLQTVAESLATLPPLLRQQIKSVDLSPSDYAIASTQANGSGVVTIYTQKSAVMKATAETANFVGWLPAILALVIAHEVGHDLTLGPHGISESEWDEAVAHDLTRVTDYGDTDAYREAMAEVFKFYVFCLGTPAEKELRQRWPARFALFDKMMAAVKADASADASRTTPRT